MSDQCDWFSTLPRDVQDAIDRAVDYALEADVIAAFTVDHPTTRTLAAVPVDLLARRRVHLAAEVPLLATLHDEDGPLVYLVAIPDELAQVALREWS